MAVSLPTRIVSAISCPMRSARPRPLHGPIQAGLRRFAGAAGSTGLRPFFSPGMVVSPVALAGGIGRIGVGDLRSGMRAGGVQLRKTPISGALSGASSGACSFFQRRSVSMLITVPPEKYSRITIIGINDGKFFGQDGTEEGMKVLQHLRDTRREAHVLLGVQEEHLKMIRTESLVGGVQYALQKLREIEGKDAAEFIPLAQCAMLEKRTYVSLDRDNGVTWNRVAMRAMRYPKQALETMYWHVFMKSKHLLKDDEKRAYFSRVAPMLADVYFNERAELIALGIYKYRHENTIRNENAHIVCAVEKTMFPLVCEAFVRIPNLKDCKNRLEVLKENPGYWNNAIFLFLTVYNLVPGTLFVYFLFWSFRKFKHWLTDRGPQASKE